MRCLVILFAILIFINLVYASCNEGQININSASLEELDGLIGIGPVKAEAIVDSRPFDSLDELVNVYGIGEATLSKIKDQGLACVDDGKLDVKKEIDSKDNNNSLRRNNYLVNESYLGLADVNENIELTPIKLNSDTKNIKSGNDENLNTKSYAIYGLFGFCILLAFLFAFKKIKDRKYKNEFN